MNKSFFCTEKQKRTSAKRYYWSYGFQCHFFPEVLTQTKAKCGINKMEVKNGSIKMIT